MDFKCTAISSIAACLLLSSCGQEKFALVENNPDGIVFTHQKKEGVDAYLGFEGKADDEIEYYHLIANHVPKGKTYRLLVRTPAGEEITGGNFKVHNGSLIATDRPIKLSEILVTANRSNGTEPIECYLVSLDNTTCVKTTITPASIDYFVHEESQDQKNSLVIAH